MDLKLRPVTLADESAFRSAHESLWKSDQFLFGLSYSEDEAFASFVDRHAKYARGIDVPKGMVPATFLVATVRDRIIGRLSIRHCLNEFLAADGGHLGYAVLQDFRGHGYATEMLRQGIVIARSLGVESALLVCDEPNRASAAVIERCGGQLIDCSTASDGSNILRYQIAG